MEKVLRIGYLTILAILPVHAFLSVWLISNVGYDTPISAWKEILLALLVPFAVVLLFRDRKLAQSIFSRLINIQILIYTGLHLLLWALNGVELDAAAAGLLINLRFLAIFVLTQILIAQGSESGDRRLKEIAGRIVVIGAIVVSVVGVLQLLVLPNDILSHFGYGPETIEPYRTIDQNKEFIRINSTMRGPNPLGLYMILALPLLLLLASNKFSYFTSRFSLKKQSLRLFINEKWKMLNDKWILSLLFVAGIITLYASHSRSGWLGAAVAVILLIWLTLIPKFRRIFSYLLVGSALVGSFVLLAFSGSDFIQNTVLHQDPDGGTDIVSTDKHWQANRNAIEDIVENPIGDGPGSAGPASVYNDEQTRIAENYYLQLGQEVGIIGLGLFIAINLLVMRSLVTRRDQLWPRLLLVSFVGLSVSNLFLHTWAQDEISLIWWGLAGLYYFE